jgi:hypothetical protein
MAEHPRRDWWVVLGLAVTATSAAVSSFAGLRGLAVVAGWPVWLAPLLPATIDSYAMTSVRVWLAESTRSVRARQFSRANAICAIVLSLTGNAVYHLVAVGLLAASWPVVVAVGAVPALVLGLVSHTAVLRTQVDPVVPEAGPSPTGSAQRELGAGPSTDGPAPDGPRYATEAELLEAARTADQAYRAAHGRGISRDALRRELRIGGARATAVLRRLKQENAAPVTDTTL